MPAKTTNWNDLAGGGNHAWATAGNWSAGVPVDGDSVVCLAAGCWTPGPAAAISLVSLDASALTGALALNGDITVTGSLIAGGAGGTWTGTTGANSTAYFGADTNSDGVLGGTATFADTATLTGGSVAGLLTLVAGTGMSGGTANGPVLNSGTISAGAITGQLCQTATGVLDGTASPTVAQHVVIGGKVQDWAGDALAHWWPAAAGTGNTGVTVVSAPPQLMRQIGI